jgi:hypothetical protein
MKILLSVGGIAYTVVSAEGGVAEPFFSDGIELYNSRNLFYGNHNIGIIIENHL